MQYSDLGMIETAEVYKIKDQMSKIHRSYRITTDKKMLEWVYKFKEKIKNFVLYNQESLEIVKIDSIPNLNNNLPEGIVVATVGIETHSFYKF